MNRKIKILIALVFFVIIGLLGNKFYQTLIEKKETAEQLVTIPEIRMKTLEHLSFSNKNLKKGVKKILVHFNSECYICQNEALKFRENIGNLGEYQILYISAESVDKIKKFATDFDLDNFDNITFLYDQKQEFYQWVKNQQVPYILVYDRNDKLIYQHNGLTDFITFHNELENEN